jgi:hypothetical protein
VVDWRGGEVTTKAPQLIENKGSSKTERVFDDEIPF